MELSALRPLLMNLRKEHIIAPKSKLVIDGKFLFKYTYRRSGCQFILGGEYDRYADYLRKYLKNFKDIGVTCYVLFNGAAVTEMGKRLETQQKVIHQRGSMDPSKEDNVFCDPIFVESVFKKILTEMGINYATCEYNHVAEMVNLARYFNSPIVTKSFAYSLFGVPCITPQSITFEYSITCKIYDPEVTKKRVALANDKLSIFLVLMDERNDYLRDLEQLIHFCENNLLYLVHRYLKRQTRDAVLSDFKKHMTKIRYELFLHDYNTTRDLMVRGKDILTLKHFQNRGIVSEDWFVKGVVTDRIAGCYINLKNSGLFSGSWLVSDHSKEDAMLPSMNIVRFAYELLTNFRSAKITFVGRVGDQSHTWEIFDSIGFERAKGTFGEVFKNGWSWNHLPDYFAYFFRVELPGFNFDVMKSVPENCRMLMAALVYYTVKVDGDNLALVHSVLLSYVMLGPVAKVTGILKKSNFSLMQSENVRSHAVSEDGLVKEDCYAAARALIELFYVNDLVRKFDRGILHLFAEFQHCLQQLNYLNKLCGERVRSTVYHKCYNATFIYNLFLEIYLMEPYVEIERMLGNSPSVLKYLKHLVEVYNNCVHSHKK